jgi:hypothetical protein
MNDGTGCLHGSLLGEDIIRGWVGFVVARAGCRDPVKIAESLGARFSRGTDGKTGWDGMLMHLPNGWAVVVNSLLSPTRADFAAAHEVTHLLILRGTVCPPAPGDPTLEKLCDVGAHELLFGWD